MGSWSDSRLELARNVLEENGVWADKLSEDEHQVAAEMFTYGTRAYDGSEEGYPLDPRLSADAWAAYWWLEGYEQGARATVRARSVDVLNPDNEVFPWMKEED